MAFPTSLDNLAATSPLATDTMVAVPHHTQHAAANTAIDALEAKVGVDNSVVTTTLDYRTKHAIVTSTAITPAASVTVDLNGVASQTLAVSQATTVTASGMASGIYKSVKVRITADSTNRAITLNASIKMLDRASSTFTVLANKSAMLVLESWGPALTDVYASVGIEQ